MTAFQRPKSVYCNRRFIIVSAMLLAWFILANACIAFAQQQDGTPLIHMVPKTDANSKPVSPQGKSPQSPAANLDYYGGPVVSNIQVVVVFWGPRVSSTVTGKIGGFFQAVTNSSYFDLLSEYSTGVTPVGGGSGTNQSIGRGNFLGEYTISPSICATAPCTVTDTQIKAELLRQLNAGNLPTPDLDANGDVNTLYMMYFPPGVTITLSGTGSCVSGGFCAYHGTTSNTFDSKHLLYGVMPDFGAGSGCDTGCGGGTEFQNISSVSSHELAETVTDADVGIATTFAPPLAWYDSNSSDQDGGGEIGDICNAEQAQISVGGSSYTVQKLWSNFEGACVSVGAHPSFALTAPSAAVGGTSFNFTVTAQNPVGGGTDASFVGTAHFKSSDPQATLPADYTFTTADQGTQTLGATLKTSGSQTITAIDTVDGAISGLATLTVNPTPPSITSLNNAVFAVGAPGSFTVTAAGLPAPSLTEAGALPSGVTFIDNGNGTGTLSGTPAAGTGGTYSITFRAHNTVSPDATQSFILSVHVAPVITTPNKMTFTVGALGTFILAATGIPTPSVSSSGALPSGVTFVDDGDGTGLLSGTPGPGTDGTYKITFKAHNNVSPDATQSFTLTVNPAAQAPSISSANNTTFSVGASGSFTVTATGNPTPSLKAAGTLPTGVSFVDNGNGTASLHGIPAAGTNGTYIITITAHNTASPDAMQDFTLTVDAAPVITSPNNVTFTVGTASSFNVTATGTPSPALTKTGTLPPGISFVDNGNGIGKLSGTPAAGANGTYIITLTAHNAISPDSKQNFTLTVNAPPTITSADSTIFAVGAAGSFTVTATGTPTPSLKATGTLPTGLSFVDNGNGTGTLSGTPAAGTNRVYSITFTAHNTLSPDATQTFSLVVTASPTISSANKTTFTVGTAGSFTVTTTGSPTPTLSETGALPSGVTFIDNGNGTGTLSGTPASSTNGTYSITFTAHDTVPPDAKQTFTLTVDAAPAITSANSATFSIGNAGSFTVTATGTPIPTLTKTGALPSGVTFVDNKNGTGTLGGTPAAGTNGVYNFTLTAHNTTSPDATQAFTLTVSVGPAITSANHATFTTGTAGSFTVTATGTPTPSLTSVGALPAGVAFVDNGNGTATLSGTPATGTNGTYSLAFTAHNTAPPDATQTFTLTVDAAPAITSANSATFITGNAGSFTVTATGTPIPTLTKTGALPSGVTFVDNKNGTGALSGTPAAGTSGVYNFTLTAHNTTSPDATQAFTLTVNSAPAITSANKATFTTGTAGSFTVTTTGTPTPSVSVSGALPSGLSFIDNGNGTGTLSGTAGAGTNGTYNVTFSAHNAAAPDATQAFTLTVNPGAQAPAITSSNATTFTVGTPGIFSVTATGTPTPSLTKTGTLPSGVTFVDNGNGTGTLSGTPASGTNKTYNITFTAHNTASPDATQAFTLTVNPGQPEVKLSPASLDFGDVDVNTSLQKNVVLKNIGSATLKIGTISLVHNFHSLFNYTTNCSSSLLSGKSCTIYVIYSAASTQETDNATLSIPDNASGSPQNVPLTAHATPIDIRFAPATLTFTPIAVGKSETKNVTLTNIGFSSLTLDSIQLAGADVSDFAETNGCPASLSFHGAQCVVKIVFTPTATGVRHGDLVVTANGGSVQQTLSFSGTGN
ncbi:MAG: beta strand repeat-containing protein [Terriglobales bacterium]